MRMSTHRFVIVAMCLSTVAPFLAAQEPFLSYDFDDGSLDDFYVASGLEAVAFCGDVLPSGTAAVEDGEVILTNDEALGISIMSLRPAKVAEVFPDPRNYSVRALVNLETTTEFNLQVRGRLGIDEPAGQIVSELERGYTLALFTSGRDPEFLDGALAIGEFGGCHALVPHTEWPNASEFGFARVDPGIEILPDEWYWIEITAQGDDEGGPVALTARVWFDGDDPPEVPQLVIEDADGLPHTPETLAAEAEVQVTLAASLGAIQEPLAVTRVDELILAPLSGCADSPFRLARSVDGADVAEAEGKAVLLYDESSVLSVTLSASDVRSGGVCENPTVVQIIESIPPGWSVESSTPEAVVDGQQLSWEVDVSALGESFELVYEAAATAGGRVQLFGEYREAESGFTFVAEGDGTLVPRSAVDAISDFSSIQHWLLLGPFGNAGGANPGAEEIVRDHLTDGDATEETIAPEAGDTIIPLYGDEAASTGLLTNELGRNPDDVPTWIEWIDLDDADDRIDFESVYGELDEALCYALCYLEVTEEVTVNFGISSDDSVHVLLDGVTLHANAVARGALDRAYQDTLLSHESLGGVVLSPGHHTLLVKIFEGGGEHNFRLGFTDEFGVELAEPPSEISVSLVPRRIVIDPQFVRGDCNLDGDGNITDGIFLLNFLFLGGSPPGCREACDNNGDGELNITNGVYLFNFLFLGGPPPPEPFPACGPPVGGPLGCDDGALGC